jgi:radical SAM/Cys-rich protein
MMSELLRHKSLKSQNSSLSESDFQLDLLNKTGLSSFQEKLEEYGLSPFVTAQLDTIQINLGKMCNQVCQHCHVDAGPDRKEIMTKETMESCLLAIASSECQTVDLTGGAPEMNPDFRWFVEEISKLRKKIIVRCNLTIINANKKYFDLPEFFRDHEIEVVSSLPYFTAGKTDSQRGDGVFESSIKALQKLNAVGYGIAGSGLILNLVYNPSGAFLPPDQGGLENEFKRKLKDRFDISFNSLFAITNLPISRFLNFLVASDNYEAYMEKLVSSFNPIAAANAMCKSTLSIGWDGYVYDCDFNQMLELKISSDKQHITEFNTIQLSGRSIRVNQHCYGCTAGAGSSCGGTTV